MLIDARQLPVGAVRTADVCVIGSGPAGITVARELLAAGLQVAVLESGGPAADAEADRLQEAADGVRFGTVDQISGTRRVGGNANLWSVQIGDRRRGLRLVPLADSDLEHRPGIPDSGWPITAADLAPAFRRAQRAFALPETGYDGALWERTGAARLPLDADVLRTDVFQFADRTTFSQQHVAALATAPGCTLYHHAYALELVTDSLGGRVTGVRAASTPGREVTFRAPAVVVAAGGLASTQLLLASPGVGRGLDRASGGRGADHLGRNFMDHPLLDGGVLLPDDPAVLDAMALYDLRRVDDVPVMGHLRLADDVLRAEPVPQLSTLLFPRHRSQRAGDPDDDRALRAWGSAVAVRDALRARRLPRPGDVWGALSRADAVLSRARHSGGRMSTYVGHGGWSTYRRPSQRFDHLRVLHQGEQLPAPHNRVRLGSQTDAFGMPRLAIDWAWSPQDAAGAARAHTLTADAVRRAGIGRLVPAVAGGSVDPVVLGSSTNHYLGTTRMSEDAGGGVVDPQCRVHGVDNLYVASTSVFPTGGFANPTLTLVALAARVADTVLVALGMA
ncbi:MAG TPA: FAD-dependent oxidoreductase [Cellulomonas sp.]